MGEEHSRLGKQDLKVSGRSDDLPAPLGMKVDLDEYTLVRPRRAPRVKNYRLQNPAGVRIGVLPLDGHWEGDNKWVTPDQTYVREGGKWRNEKGEVIADCNEGRKQPEAESTRRLRESLRESAGQPKRTAGNPAWVARADNLPGEGEKGRLAGVDQLGNLVGN
ncbi:hypothetical protein AOQ84DRAFT_362934 [Glonium stellatum]|uniref:Uncharacterized protein n=1 Tax=Glonium stellatum TaxID=574774 RepID=A0A8E2F479_9PEZI|nr:hypothetical protein AOQ84DRAFT_362934 [Glonium stellatum]